MSAGEYTTLTLSSQGGIARLVLDNGPINLLDGQMFAELAEAIDRLAADDDVRVVLLASANPDFFIAHFDVTLIQRFPVPGDRAQPAPDRPNPFHAMCEQLRTMPKATIAVIEGRVGGGGSELALSCDMRFAARGRAVFNQPEVALGIIPGGSGTVRLPRLIGRSRALEVILGCDDVDAELAERWGWVNRALDTEALWRHVDNLAVRIASFPAHAVAAAKASVLRAESGIAEHLRGEGAAFQATLGWAEAQSAMAAFMAGGGQTRDGELQLGALAGRLRAQATSSGAAEAG